MANAVSKKPIAKVSRRRVAYEGRESLTFNGVPGCAGQTGDNLRVRVPTGQSCSEQAEPSLAGVVVTQSLKRRQESCGVRAVTASKVRKLRRPSWSRSPKAACQSSIREMMTLRRGGRPHHA